MATKKPAKPKYLKYPKKPKASSSTAVLERYLAKKKEIDAENRARKSAYEKAARAYEADRKKHDKLVKQISGIGSPLEGLKKRSTPARNKAVSGTKKRATTRKTTKRKTTRRRR